MIKSVYTENRTEKFMVSKKYYRTMGSLIKNALVNKKKRKVYFAKAKQLRQCHNKAEYPHNIVCNPKSKIAVYTVLFGEYDKIKPVGYKSPRCDYYIVTDLKVDDYKGWTKIDFTLPRELLHQSNVIKNRYFKMHPDVLFPDYEYSIYLDATMEPAFDIFPLVGRLSEKFIGMYRHETRNCIYEEAKTVVRVGKADKAEVDKLIKKYESEGYPHDFGLTHGGIILRKHTHPECINLMDEWWSMFMNGPKRDQLSLLYCLWKNGYSLEDIACLGPDYNLEPRFGSDAHIK